MAKYATKSALVTDLAIGRRSSQECCSRVKALESSVRGLAKPWNLIFLQDFALESRHDPMMIENYTADSAAETPELRALLRVVVHRTIEILLPLDLQSYM